METTAHEPAHPRSARTLDRAAVMEMIARFGQVGAVLLSIAYMLGAMSVAGQLRALGLHQPTVLSGFAHDDVLMKGVGVLFNHIPSLITLALLAVLALDERARLWVHDALEPGSVLRASGSKVTRSGEICFKLGFALLALTAVATAAWWEGTLVVAAVYTYIAFAWRYKHLMSAGGMLGIAFFGALIIGGVGAFAHPPPLPEVELIQTDGKVVEGGLIGSGQRGDWYVATHSDPDHDGDRIRVVPAKRVQAMDLREPVREEPETTWEQLF